MESAAAAAGGEAAELAGAGALAEAELAAELADAAEADDAAPLLSPHAASASEPNAAMPAIPVAFRKSLRVTIAFYLPPS
jgi:hypothetical protein